MYSGLKIQIDPELIHRDCKGPMDLVRSRGCYLGARGCNADIIHTYF
jgi:hypothetical protein